MMNETTTGITPEMTIPDAVKIVREEAAKSTGEVRSALTMLADYAMPVIPHDEPAAENGELPPKPERGKIGIKSNATAILAWNLKDGLNIVVSAWCARAGYWDVQLKSCGDVRLSAAVVGGRETASNLVRALRNGMTRRCMKIKRNHAKRRTAAVPSVPSVPDVPSSGQEVQP